MQFVLTKTKNLSKILQTDFKNTVFPPNGHDLLKHVARKYPTMKQRKFSKTSLTFCFLNVNGKLHHKLEIGHPVRETTESCFNC